MAKVKGQKGEERRTRGEGRRAKDEGQGVSNYDKVTPKVRCYTPPHETDSNRSCRSYGWNVRRVRAINLCRGDVREPRFDVDTAWRDHACTDCCSGCVHAASGTRRCRARSAESVCEARSVL